MEEEFRSEEYQGRSKEHMKRIYDGIRIQSKLLIVIVFVLLTYSLVKFIIE
jgi:hypothetical protein